MNETGTGTEGLSRRDVVGMIGTGVATLAATAAAVLPAQTAQAAAGEQPPRPEKLENPTDKYPKPPFPSQEQPWPGLTSKMTPRPDHGEQSYRGSGRLAGRKALITGGDSGDGAGRRYRLCPRGGRCRDQLSSRRGAGRA